MTDLTPRGRNLMNKFTKAQLAERVVELEDDLQEYIDLEIEEFNEVARIFRKKRDYWISRQRRGHDVE